MRIPTPIHIPAMLRLPRALRATVLTLGLMVAAALTLTLLCLALTRVEPSWWTHARAEPGDALIADAIENQIVSACSRVRELSPTPDGQGLTSAPWTIRISQRQANAWLRARLPRWIRHGALDTPLARSVLGIRVAFRDGAVLAGVAADFADNADTRAENPTNSRADGGQSSPPILWARLVPRVGNSGELLCPARSVGLGGMPLPLVLAPPSALETLRKFGLEEALAGSRSAPWRARFDLDGGRTIAVESIRVGPAWIELRATTRATLRAR